MKEYCNNCNELIELNEMEKAEFEAEGSFVCSSCINNEMEDESDILQTDAQIGSAYWEGRL